MKAETKKYLRKRKQIIDIIMQMDVQCQDKEDGMLYDYTVKPQFWESRDTAEKILAKVGISKPKELEKEIAKWKEANFELLCHPAIAEAATNEKMLSNLYSELDDCHDRIRELESCLNSTSGR